MVNDPRHHGSKSPGLPEKKIAARLFSCPDQPQPRRATEERQWVLRTPLHIIRTLVFLCSAWFQEPRLRSKTPFPLCHCLVGRCLPESEREAGEAMPRECKADAIGLERRENEVKPL